MNMEVSHRIQRLISVENPTFSEILCKEWKRNEYHPVTNKKGIINMGAAENRLLSDVMLQKLKGVDLSKLDESMLVYQDIRGMPDFRAAIAQFLSEVTKSTQSIDPNKICLSTGITSLLDIIPYILCDDGDVILVPAPVYGGIFTDAALRSNVKVYPVHVTSKPGASGEEPFQLTVDHLEKSYAKATKEGHRVRAMLLTNPLNPLGLVYTRDQVLAYLQFCKRHELHVLADEIYVGTAYDSSAPPSSVLSFSEQELPDPQRTHFMWSFAKFFSFCGCQCGVFYSRNESVLCGLAHLLPYHQVSSLTQFALTQILQDKDWVHGSYLPMCRQRLQESRDITMATLDELGVSYVKPSAGFYVWVNFSKFLSEPTSSEESLFYKHLLSQGVRILPSVDFHGNEPGWFRVVYSLPLTELQEALQRLRQGCQSYAPPPGPEGGAEGGEEDDEILHVSSDGGDTLEDLVRTLKVGIRNSDWLEQNSSTKWREENPETYRDYMAEIEKCTQRTSKE